MLQAKETKSNDDYCIFFRGKVAKSNICVRHFVGKIMQQYWSFLLFVTSSAALDIDLMMQGKWRAECLMSIFGFSALEKFKWA